MRGVRGVLEMLNHTQKTP